MLMMGMVWETQYTSLLEQSQAAGKAPIPSRPHTIYKLLNLGEILYGLPPQPAEAGEVVLERKGAGNGEGGVTRVAGRYLRDRLGCCAPWVWREGMEREWVQEIVSDTEAGILSSGSLVDD